jgi:hypothetical protein
MSLPVKDILSSSDPPQPPPPTPTPPPPTTKPPTTPNSPKCKDNSMTKREGEQDYKENM